MPPVKPQKNVQLKKPNMKSIGLAKDKNCPSKICYTKQKKCEYDDFKSQSTKEDRLLCSDKKCQEIKRPGKPKSDTWSVTKVTDMQSPKSATLYSDKNCQSTRCYSLRKKSPRRPRYDKNCQL